MVELSFPIALAVAGGGALGATARASLDSLLTARFNWRSPWPIITINILGSFCLGLLVGAQLNPIWTALGGIGFCGAFTTMSTAMLDAVKLLAADVTTPAHTSLATHRLRRLGTVITILIVTVIAAVLAAGAGISLTSG